MTRHEQLESDLRAAAGLFDEVTASPDAWQENLRRLGSPRRRAPGWRTLAAVAAAVVLVLVVGSALLSGSGPDDGMPAGGSKGGDPWAPENVLGEPVDAETLTVDGARTVHQIVLTDTSGNGPDLCDRYVAEDSSSGGCTTRDPKADDDSVAVDWLSGGEGGGLKGVTGGVDARVAKVQVWMSNGDMVPARLHPTGWDGTKMFALTVQGDAPVPQRVVAYSDATGTVLQAVDLGDRFGSGWLPRAGTRCSGTATGTWPPPGSGGTGDLTVSLWSASASVTSRTPGAGGSTCLRLGPGALAGSLDVAGRLVVVTGPEVVTVELRSSPGTTVPGSSRKVGPSAGSPFQLAVLPEPPSGAAGYRIVALDVSGRVVDQRDLSSVAE